MTEEMLRFWNYEGVFASEAGKFTAFIGGCSDTVNKIGFSLIS